MKKLLVMSFIITGLLIGSPLYAISPKRAWECRPTSPQKNCSDKEKGDAKKLFGGAIAGVLAVTLVAAGIAGATWGKVEAEKKAAKEQAEAAQVQAQKEEKEQAQVAKNVQDWQARQEDKVR